MYINIVSGYKKALIFSSIDPVTCIEVSLF